MEVNKEKLEKAREYEQIMGREIPQEQRPSFHVSAPVGWINDPNGFSVYKGEYHLFYQYNPFEVRNGLMHWGHSKSKDLIKWEQLQTALAPDREYDAQGCFSGSALEYEEKHVLMYTGVQEKKREDGSSVIFQTQCIAVGDGKDYEKLEKNPVITHEQLPKGSSLTDFRDPKIWKEQNSFYAAVGSRSADDSGQIVLFRTENLTDWNYITVLDSCKNEYGKMWECPDFFALDGKQVLLISPQDMIAKELEFHNGNGTVYFIGNYETDRQSFKRESVGTIEYGLDFYAPQTLETEDGRRIMIGWMQSWENHLVPGDFLWSGMMTIPRELNIRGGKLIQNPVRELAQYYKQTVTFHDLNIHGDMTLEKVAGRCIDLTVEVTGGDFKVFTIAFAKNKEFQTIIEYKAEENKVSINREYSGTRKDMIHKRSMYVADRKHKIKVRLLLDKFSAELFVNDGEQAMSALIYTPLDAKDISFYTEGDAYINIVKHDIG
ncbi:glycoside hydrolase family 32 protein [Clostridium sp. E02]|uniref:glycoside hydrolase family 32 protein n=1 Tax=Clostridium sp. E02 TaxID=2487134 RepID=UPI00325B3BEE